MLQRLTYRRLQSRSLVRGAVAAGIGGLLVATFSAAATPAAGQAGVGSEVGACPGEPARTRFDHELPAVPPSLDVVFAFDLTGSMGGVVRQMQDRATEVLEDTVALFGDARFGVASFRDYPFSPYGGTSDFAWRVDQVVTGDHDAVRTAVAGLVASGGGDGPESYSRVLFEAVHPDNSLGWRGDARKVLIVFGDNYPHDDDLNDGVAYPQPVNPGGVYNSGVAPPWLDPGRSGDEGHNLDTSDDIDFQPTLDAMRDSNITLLAVMNSFARGTGGDSPTVVYWRTWAERTAAGGLAVPHDDTGDLAAVILELLETSARRLGSLRIGVSPGRYESWVRTEPEEYEDIEVPPEGLALGYDVIVTPPLGTPTGDHRVFLSLIGDGVEYERREIVIKIDPGCAPTPTPVALDPLFLPIALSERYVPKRLFSDVALVLDASSSMRGAKIEAARDAAQVFVSGADLPNNRVALVVFESSARVAEPMTGDAEALRQAISRVKVTPGTRIDLGLEVALQELDRARLDDERMQVLILLTDGVQIDFPERPHELADTARERGVRLYAVGLGSDVDAAYLTGLVGGSRRYFPAPEPEDLRPIFDALARDLPCPADEFWGRRC